MNHHPFEKLRAKMSPERRRQSEEAAKKMLADLLLRELREQSGQTQQELAAALGVAQPTMAQYEKQDDMHVSTLRRIVEALGGELDLVVRLPAGEYRVGGLTKRPA